MQPFSLKKYLFFLFALLIASSGVLAYIMVNVNPNNAGFLEFAAFYISLFLVASSILTLAGYIFRAIVSRNAPLYSFAVISLRQGALMSLFLIALLFLQAFQSLSIMAAGLLIGSLTLLEIAFLTR